MSLVSELGCRRWQAGRSVPCRSASCQEAGAAQDFTASCSRAELLFEACHAHTPADKVAAALTLPLVGLVVPDLGVHGVVHSDVVALKRSLQHM